MAKEKIIKNNVVWENFRLQEELNGFQGNLKIEDKKLNRKLQDRIIKVWFNAPIFIRLNDWKYYILDWHQRLQALSELSKRWYILEWWKIPVVEILADTEIEAKERIMDYSSAYALFDIPVLQGRSQELDMEFTNIPELSLDTPSMGDDFDLPSDEIKTDIVLWDLFEIGEHRLLCWDSTKKEDVAKLMNGEKADILLCDPPYWIDLDTDYSKMWSTKTKYEKIKWDEVEFDMTAILQNSNTKEQYIRWWDYFTNSLDFQKWTQIVRAKRHSEEENKVFWSWYEILWVSYKCKKSIRFIRPINQSSERLWKHPTQKPIECMTRAIQMSKLQWIIIDLFLWSWSTMVASHQLNRKCYWMELDPKYCQVIIDRMIKLDPTLEIKKNWLSYNPISNG